jgi:predicted SprT family Zn-dependent metalloprotease
MPTDPITESISRLIRAWGGIWGVPGLESSVDVRFSSRLRWSLGRCRPGSGRITLHADLRHERRSLLPEVLCHEVAHVVAYRAFGGRARPHGAEWRELVRAAGFSPSVRMAGAGRPPAPARPLPGVLPFEHRCPVCQMIRFAKRPVRAWRCADCLDAGLPGELIITRRGDGVGSPPRPGSPPT